ncbi:Fic family protein [Chryseobacterium wangxinyae]|uniref:Fic family protein n=1 Tax=Chryseobacterium sp. CY350 TaxID=2997336 RepID=UPI00226FEB5A|nr:Fic family protein [Chryseobacterium sp. CY350]MCY0979124.1 Fic family protein [Chryseobacterium sp. CY350]WBZ94698.1 Fic family protein [Chryseobacterium sp. CY350]
MKNIKILENLIEIKSIDEKKKSIDSNRPFSNELENKIFQKLKLDWNYNSNAIEGNQLSYGETIAFLNFGLTAKGKPFKDHLDIKGHNEAIGFMLQLIKENRPLSESDIKDLHKIILVEPYFSKTISPQGIEFEKEIKIGQYKTSPNHVKTVSGDIHYYTNPEEVAFEMNNLLEWYRNAEEENLHPIVISAIFHHKFTSIHPFDDGNGRLARILSNFILLKHQYPVIVIKNKHKIQYYSALNIADNGIYEDLVKLFAENIGFSLDIMQKAINGENINEADDLDKEIELFVKEMEIHNTNIVDVIKDKDFLIDTYIKGLFDYLSPKLSKFESLFQESYLFFSETKFLINDYKSLIDRIKEDNELLLNDDFTISIVFDDHVNYEFNVDLDITITIKKKTLKYFVKEEHSSYDEAMLESYLYRNTVFSKIYSYDSEKESIYNEVTKGVVNYLIDFIKNKTKQG